MRFRSLLLGMVLLACGLRAQGDFQDRYQEAILLTEASPARREAFDRALSLFLRVPTTDANYRRWVGMAAYCAAQAGKSRLAQDLYARAWELDHRGPKHLDGWLRAMIAGSDATEAVLLGHRVRAEARYRATLDRAVLDPRLYLPLVNAAAALLRQGQFDPGLWVFQRQAGLQPRDPYAQANLGLALRQVGRPAAAREAYERALVLAPGSEIANDLGLLLKGIGERDAAAAAFKRSLGLQEVPGRGSAATNLGVLYSRAGIRVRPDPVADLGAQLAEDPQQSLARRVSLDLLARETTKGKPTAASRRHQPGE